MRGAKLWRVKWNSLESHLYNAELQHMHCVNGSLFNSSADSPGSILRPPPHSVVDFLKTQLFEAGQLHCLNGSHVFSDMESHCFGDIMPLVSSSFVRNTMGK